MKKSFTIFLTAGLTIFLSCNEKDHLNLSPQTYLNSSTFYKTETHFDQALVGVYSSLRAIPTYGVFMDEMRSDNTFFTLFSGDRSQTLHSEAIAQFLDDDQASYTINRYSNNYIGIFRANTLLAKIADFSEIDAGKKERIIGETLFLRAFFYFDLVTHYGGVPLQLDVITSEVGASLHRATAEEVFTQVISDLTSAISVLPVVESFPQSGRVTKGAAKMLMAYTYMTKPTRDYVRASQELRDILTMNYSLMDNYADCFDPAKKNNRESIFEIQFKDGNDGLHSDFIWRFAPKTINSKPITGLNVALQHISWGGWNVPTQDLIDSYESGDQRLNVSIAIAEGVNNEAGAFSIERIIETEGYTPPPGKIHYYFVNKYNHGPYSIEFVSGENWPVFRFSDVLLLLSECLVEQGLVEQAVPYVNQVRARAGLPGVSSVNKEVIARERRHELAFENHRWLDLVRTGTAIAVMQVYGNATKQEFGWILPNAFNITEERLIYPLPFRELQINRNLTQNPGYH